MKKNEKSEKRCWNCKWLSDDFTSVCVNAKSEHRADFVDADDLCAEFEELTEEQRKKKPVKNNPEEREKLIKQLRMHAPDGNQPRYSMFSLISKAIRMLEDDAEIIALLEDRIAIMMEGKENAGG